MIATLAMWSVVVVAASGTLWWGTGVIDRSTTAIADHLGLPDLVKGALLVAVASSLPELATTIIAAWGHGELELGVAAVLGSALFNVLVIPGVAAWASSGPLVANRDLVHRDLLFYLFAVAVLMVSLLLAFVLGPVAPASEGDRLGTWSRALAMLPVGAYAVYLFLQHADVVDHVHEGPEPSMPAGMAWARLLASLVVIVGAVEALVQAALALGELLGTPSFLWGFTVVAAATSVPDALVSVRAARGGQATTSLANVLGSNVFDLLVAVPAGVLVAGAAVVNLDVVGPLMACLVAATTVLLVVMRTGSCITRTEGVVLLGTYGLIVGGLGAEIVGWIDWVPGLPP